MKIIFRKISKYNYHSKDKKSDFEYVSSVLNQTINPHSEKAESVITPESQIVYVSSLNRARECIKTRKGQKIITSKVLNEIPFELKSFVNEKSYLKYGSISVRKAFIKAFLDDDLLITREQLFKQIESLLKKIERSKHSIVSVISHSFRLKLIQAYISTNGKIITNPKLIRKFIKPNERTFNFEEEFEVNIQYK